MSAASSEPSLVVGVGASAGGLEAFKQLMSALPNDAGMAFLLVQHLDPTHESLLRSLLAPCTGMPVCEANQGVVIERNTVYIIQPDTALAVNHGKIEISEPKMRRGVRLPVDHLFSSLAQQYGVRAAAIVLSGAGSDGSAGMRDIKSAGGLTIAQNPKASGQRGMPQSAVDTGVVDLVLDIEEMPGALARFDSLPLQQRAEDEAASDTERPEPMVKLAEPQLGQLAALLEAQADFDLRVYKAGTIERRVIRRMTLSGFDDVDAYLDHLRSDRAEQQTLVRDLLISVTDFFRDPKAYDSLRQQAIRPLVSAVSDGETLRVWIAGCATGEEAYSIGMELLDAIRDEGKQLTVQIFATDVDQDALAVGRAGIYPASIVSRVSEERLQRYFKPLESKGYQVRSPLRDVVSFAAHDLTKDPPFSRMHVVSCRNVMIYLTPDAQQHVLKVLHFALQPTGYLFLSTSESTGPQRDLFSTLSKPHRVYAKVGASRPLSIARSRSRPPPEHGADSYSAREPKAESRTTASGDLARRAVVEAFAPPTLVVSADGTVVFSHGHLDPYVRIPQGDYPTFELTNVVRPELVTRVRGALYKCRRDQKPVTAISSPEKGQQNVQIEARPAPALGDDAVMVTFKPLHTEQHSPAHETAETPEQEAVIEQLERELQATREDLHNTVEELESSNEELRSSNEESMSMNEELQSANEELEATTEELRSLNEELTTVNAQLRDKVEQLEQAHDDLSNFVSSTKIATIFLDDSLCIKRVTPAAEELLALDHADRGRRVVDIARELLQNDLEQEIKHVLDHLTGTSREIRTRGGQWIARQVLPYRTESRRIEGVVVTFVDVTDLKSAAERLAVQERRQSTIARVGLHALRETDLQSFMDQTVREVQEALGTDFCKILEAQPGGQKLLLRAGVGWRPDQLRHAYVDGGPASQAGYTLRASEPVLVEDLSQEKRFSGPSLLIHHGVTSGISCVISNGGQPYGVLGAHTEERRVFSNKDVDFLRAIAGVIGSAIARAHTRIRLAAEAAVAHVLAESADLEEALPALLEKLTSAFSAAVGEVWWHEDATRSLRCRARHVALTSRHPELEDALEEDSFDPGEGLVGSVYASSDAAWCTDLTDAQAFVRQQAAQELGLRTGFAFPIRGGNEALGVVTLLSFERMTSDEVMLRSLEGLGRSIGDFALRSNYGARSRRLAAIARSSHDAIVAYHLDGTVSEWLPGAERSYGYTTREMQGESIESIVPEDAREALGEYNRRIAAGEVLEPMESTRINRSGELLAVSVRGAPIYDSHGQVVGISSTERDITRQKETEQKLMEAARQKDEFLAMLGHELRNPLAAIRSAAELMKLMGSEDAEQLDRTQAVLERQSAHMAKLLDGLLDVSRIIRGKIELERARVDLAAVCRDVASDAASRIGHRNIELEVQVPDEPLWVDGDAVRLTQIADNLLSNALKYTRDPGKVTLELRSEGHTAVLEVSDSGVGIEPELLPHIFDVFRQSEQTLDRSSGGLGLGLALVKSLSLMHGGAVEAKSEGKGRGAQFTVRLPIKDAPPVQAQSETTNGRPLRVLLIEDNPDSAEMLKQVLQLSSHEVIVASSAKQGIDAARSHKPNIVLCDLGLPDGMSGFDVAKALREKAETQGIPLVALTGYGRPEDKARCEDAGFDAHLTKPVDTARISELLSQLCQRGTAHRSTA